MPKSINIDKALADQVSAYATQHGLSWSAAACQLLGQALKVQVAVPQWGGQRWHQCGRCGGWNVGVMDDGEKICADCGWSSENEN